MIKSREFVIILLLYINLDSSIGGLLIYKKIVNDMNYKCSFKGRYVSTFYQNISTLASPLFKSSYIVKNYCFLATKFISVLEPAQFSAMELLYIEDWTSFFAIVNHLIV